MNMALACIERSLQIRVIQGNCQYCCDLRFNSRT